MGSPGPHTSVNFNYVFHEGTNVTQGIYGDIGVGKQVTGARQSGCRCRADRLQVLGRQVAGAGQTGRPSGPG